MSVSLWRTNGCLGYISANFTVQPGLAQSGSDYSYNGAPPTFWTASQFTTHPSRERADGLTGLGGFLVDPYGLSLTLADSALNKAAELTVSIIKNKSVSGNLSATFQVANPSDTFYLGGQPIPVGAALGISSSTLTLVDDTSYPGTFGFTSPTYVATNLERGHQFGAQQRGLWPGQHPVRSHQRNGGGGDPSCGPYQQNAAVFVQSNDQWIHCYRQKQRLCDECGKDGQSAFA